MLILLPVLSCRTGDIGAHRAPWRGHSGWRARGLPYQAAVTALARICGREAKPDGSGFRI